ncbi:MAG: hypothetical protein ACXWZS_15975 [Gemmatirosa sp.]
MSIALRRTRLGLCALSALAAPLRAVRAQEPPLAPAAIGEIVTETLRATVHPDASLSGVPVAQRGLRFDHARTMAAFGRPDALTVAISDTRLRAITTPGSQDLLADCDQVGSKPCSRIGGNAYVWVEPRAIDVARALVRVHVGWAGRPGRIFDDSGPTRGRSFYTAFAQDVHLVRTRNGRWTFERFGMGIASE